MTDFEKSIIRSYWKFERFTSKPFNWKKYARIKGLCFNEVVEYLVELDERDKFGGFN